MHVRSSHIAENLVGEDHGIVELSCETSRSGEACGTSTNNDSIEQHRG